MSYLEKNSKEINGITYQFTWVDNQGWWRCESQAWWGGDGIASHNLTQSIVFASDTPNDYNQYNPFKAGTTYWLTGYHDDSGRVLIADSANSTGFMGYTSSSYMPRATYTVSFNANGGGGGPTSQTKYWGTDLTLTSLTPTRAGYTFSHWDTKSDGTGTDYSPGGSYKTNAGIILYAQWTANEYTIYFDAEGGSITQSSVKVTYNSGDNNDVYWLYPTKPGYTFDGWYTASGETQVYDASGKCTTDGGYWSATARWQGTSVLTVYAHWTANRTKVIFNPNGGITTDGPQFHKDNNHYGNGNGDSYIYITYDTNNFYGMHTATKPGYTFDGWFTAASGGTEIYDSDGLQVKNTAYWNSNGIWKCVEEEITVYAHWLPVITINYYMGDKVVTDTFDDPTKATIRTLPSTGDPGVIAIGWSTSQNTMEGDCYAGKKLSWTNPTTLNLYYFTLSSVRNLKIYYKGTNREITKLRLNDKIELKWEILSNFEVGGFNPSNIKIIVGFPVSTSPIPDNLITINDELGINSTSYEFTSSLKEILSRKVDNPKDYIDTSIGFYVQRYVYYNNSDFPESKRESYITTDINKILNSSGIVNVKYGEEWKEGQVWAHNGGKWKEAATVYIKDNNKWKESI